MPKVLSGGINLAVLQLHINFCNAQDYSRGEQRGPPENGFATPELPSMINVLNMIDSFC